MISTGVKKAVLAATMAVLLASCGTKPAGNLPSYKGTAEIDRKIAESTASAAKAQEELARIQIARTKPAPLPLDESNLPAELLRPQTLNWSGPAHEAANKIADLIGYSFQVTGNRPSIPPSIHVTMVDVSAAKGLENIGLQAFPFGEVSVDPNIKRVEFRYLSAHQQAQSPIGTSPRLGK